ncbi:MAG TPA: GGDEF domain-containing protein [Gammaproteobacteria bacterium]|nr:GGDEF domain-containing protein [Gammaproteobacteria bacterium]
MRSNFFLNRSYELFTRVLDRACLPTDSAVEKTSKGVVLITAIIIAFLAIFWGLSYVALGYPISGAIPLGYAGISFLGISYFLVSRRFVFFRFTQLLLILLLPFLLQWSLGGFSNGSVVMVWAFFTPLAAMLFTDVRQATRWLYAFLGLTALSAVMDGTLANIALPMPPLPNAIFFALNMGCGFTSVFIVLNYFVKERERSHDQAMSAKESALAAQKALEVSNQQLRDNETKIHELMLTDWLTGVGNRRHLDECLRYELGRIQRYNGYLSIVMADLDHFKQVNDIHGHDVGDTVISVFASIVSDTIRNTDSVFRFGGEEFLIILPETSESGAIKLAERIRVLFAEYEITPLPTPVTASFGVACANVNDNLDSLLKRADQALYRAKESGRNCCAVFTDNISMLE